MPLIKVPHCNSKQIVFIVKLINMRKITLFSNLINNCRWSLIAGRLPGRTANNVKNYWNTHLLKKFNPSNKELKPKPHHNPSKPKINVIKPWPRTLSMNSFPVRLDGNKNATATPASSNLEVADGCKNNSYCLSGENDEMMWWENFLMNDNDVDDQPQGSFNNSNLSGLGDQAISEELGERRSKVV